jgi:hypothetical protein
VFDSEILINTFDNTAEWKHRELANKMPSQYNIHGPPVTAIPNRHPVSMTGYLPPSQGINNDDF